MSLVYTNKNYRIITYLCFQVSKKCVCMYRGGGQVSVTYFQEEKWLAHCDALKQIYLGFYFLQWIISAPAQLWKTLYIFFNNNLFIKKLTCPIHFFC